MLTTMRRTNLPAKTCNLPQAARSYREASQIFACCSGVSTQSWERNSNNAKLEGVFDSSVGFAKQGGHELDIT